MAVYLSSDCFDDVSQMFFAKRKIVPFDFEQMHVLGVLVWES